MRIWIVTTDWGEVIEDAYEAEADADAAVARMGGGSSIGCIEIDTVPPGVLPWLPGGNESAP